MNSFNLSSLVTLLSHQDLLRNWGWGSSVGLSMSPPDPYFAGNFQGCTRSTTGLLAAGTFVSSRSSQITSISWDLGDSQQDCPFPAS